MSALQSARQLLENYRLLVTVGSGGVGKTTVSAALGLWAAQQGKHVLVITIDPARRLATSLGLEETGNRIVEVEGAVTEGEGKLFALMLDARSTFDELIHRISPDVVTRDRILANRIYRLLADSLAGSQNVMATEKLYEVMRSEQFDLVVLDTPPTSNALDFLESSGYFVRFLDDRIMSWLLPQKDGGGGLRARLMAPAQNMAGRLMAALFGRAFFDELLDFFDAFSTLYRGFRERAAVVRQMLQAPGTAFAVVCRPLPLSLTETKRLAEQLTETGHSVQAWFVNQCGPFPGRKPDHGNDYLGPKDRAWLRKKLDNDEPEAVIAVLEECYKRAVAHSDEDLAYLAQLGPDPQAVLVHHLPRLADEVVELPALQRFARLFE